MNKIIILSTKGKKAFILDIPEVPHKPRIMILSRQFFPWPQSPTKTKTNTKILFKGMNIFDEIAVIKLI